MPPPDSYKATIRFIPYGNTAGWNNYYGSRSISWGALLDILLGRKEIPIERE